MLATHFVGLCLLTLAPVPKNDPAKNSATLGVGFFGVKVVEDPGGGKIVIQEVLPNSAALDAGLKVQDRILAVGDVKIESVKDFSDWRMKNSRAGMVVPLKIERPDGVVIIKVKLTPPPATSDP